MNDDVEESSGSAEYVKYVKEDGAVKLFVFAFTEADYTLRTQFANKLRFKLHGIVADVSFVLILNRNGDVWIRFKPALADHTRLDDIIRRLARGTDVTITAETTSTVGNNLEKILLRAGFDGLRF